MAVLLRRHDGAGAARRHQPAAPCDALFARGADDLQHADRCRLDGRGRRQARRRRARDRQIRPDRRVGRQSGLDPDQRDDPHRAGAKGARRPARRHRSLPHRHRRGRRYPSGAAARHRRRARLRRHACAVQGGLRRPRLSGALYRRPGRARSASRGARPGLGGARSPASAKPRSSTSRASMAAPSAAISGSATAFRDSAQRRGAAVRGELPAGGDRRLAVRGRRRALLEPRPAVARPDADRRARRRRSRDPHPRPVAHRRDPHRRPARPRRRPAGDGAAHPEHQPDGGGAGIGAGARRLRAATICSSACTSSS